MGKLKIIWNYLERPKIKFLAVNFSDKDLMKHEEKILNEAFEKGWRIGHVFEREHAVVYELYLDKA